MFCNEIMTVLAAFVYSAVGTALKIGSDNGSPANILIYEFFSQKY